MMRLLSRNLGGCRIGRKNWVLALSCGIFSRWLFLGIMSRMMEKTLNCIPVLAMCKSL